MKKIGRMIILITILAFALSSQGLVADEQTPDSSSNKMVSTKSGEYSYIVLMSLDPVISYEGEIKGLSATKPVKRQKLNVRDPNVRSYRQLLKTKHDNALKAAGIRQEKKIHDYTVALNGFSAIMTKFQAKELSKQAGVVSVRPDEMRFKTTDHSPDFLGLTGKMGPWSNGITGEDVVVGVIDTGIWPEHPSFADSGDYNPLQLNLEDTPENPACNFGNTNQNPGDVPFECNNKLIGARQMLATYRAIVGADPDEFDSARDDDGHGTHTASTAAGNAGVEANMFDIPRSTVSGIAPRARVIAYKGLGKLGGFSSDLAAAIDQAVADGVDVINYSVGGGASLIGADDIAYLFAADAGVFVATSAGNSGPEPATIGGPASVPWITTVGANTHNRAFISDITLTGPGHSPRRIWGGSVTTGIENYNLIDAEGIPDTMGDTSGMCLNPFPEGTFKSNDCVLCNTYDFGTARTERVGNVADSGGGAVIFHNSENVNVTPTDNHPLPTVHMLYKVGIPLKQYLVNHPGQIGVSFTQGEAKPENRWWDPRVRPYVMASFSSRGPNPVAMDIIKPDVTAPGISILAGASPTHAGTAEQNQLFQAIMGTSMSSPEVAGVLALIKQAHPNWSPAMAKSALMTTAHPFVRKEDGRTKADPFDIGAGHIKPGSINRISPFNPGLTYDAGFNEYLGFLCSAAPEIFSDPEGTCGYLASIGIPLDPSDLNLPSIGVADLAGVQTVQRTVTNVTDKKMTFRGLIKHPRGYRIKVTPKRLTLEPGESGSYNLEITNKRAPIGEWRFGSISWISMKNHTKYLARSPIAVRGSMIDVPTELTGSGADGSLSFDVKFGYTGSYTAASHGLEAATVATDNVLQDPDQTFDPNDGFSVMHSFTLSGAALFRVALPPEATEADADLDVYVFDPNGVMVASSTNGATDELINITQPADGVWRVYIHGWSTPGGDSDYQMYSWAISNTPGGNLIIDAAPGSAVLGTIEPIEISWTGSAGNWYLGAISHTGNEGLMNLTIINVDNRQ